MQYEATLLDVPYHSQEGRTAKRYCNDCGPACVRMLWGYDRLRRGLDDPAGITVDDFAQRVLETPRSFSTVVDLQRLGAMYGLTLRPVSTADGGLVPDRMRAELLCGRPVIALVLYRALKARLNQAFSGGHFVVVAGFDDEHYYLNDPDWYGERVREGHCWRVPAEQLEAAMAPERNPFFSVPWQGLIYVPR